MACDSLAEGTHHPRAISTDGATGQTLDDTLTNLEFSLSLKALVRAIRVTASGIVIRPLVLGISGTSRPQGDAGLPSKQTTSRRDRPRRFRSAMATVRLPSPQAHCLQACREALEVRR